MRAQEVGLSHPLGYTLLLLAGGTGDTQLARRCRLVRGGLGVMSPGPGNPFCPSETPPGEPGVLQASGRCR